MSKHHFLYSNPEDVQVSSKKILQFIENLELAQLEPHGLIMVRHSRIFCEGFWQPFSPALIHGMQSLSKTYTATAIGLAIADNLLSLDTKITELFPDYCKYIVDSQMYEITIRHLLTMSVGFSKISDFEGDWIENFFSSHIIHKPGTHFDYNSVCSTLLGAIIQKITGMKLQQYLSSRLCPRIGLDKDSMKWLCLSDGLEIGGSGLYTTMYNNLALALLYLCGGVVNGERILTEEYVSSATTRQIDNGNFSDDHTSGYGFQMWMCHYKNAYRMDGAMGQFVIVLPDEDMVILYTGTLKNGEGDKHFFQILWDFVDHAFIDKNEITDGKSVDHLRNRVTHLALPMPKPNGIVYQTFKGIYHITEGLFHIEPLTGGIMQSYYPPHPLDGFEISFDVDECRLTLIYRDCNTVIYAGMDGIPRFNRVHYSPYPVEKLLCSAIFPDSSSIEFHFRWVETCFSFILQMELSDNYLLIRKKYPIINPELSNNLYAKAERI